jgi:hypothetical protein
VIFEKKKKPTQEWASLYKPYHHENMVQCYDIELHYPNFFYKWLLNSIVNFVIVTNMQRQISYTYINNTNIISYSP